MFDTFVIEEKHGFNKQTLSFFLRDQAKKFVVSLALLLIVVAGVIWIIQKGGDYFFVYVFLFASAVLFVILTIYPEFIAPLFDKYELLADGELKSKIERLADSVQYPLKKIFIVEGSKRSSHSNAYLFGFWKNKRIVLYDTLVESRPLTSLESDKKTDTGGQVINTANESTKDKNIEADNRILGMKDDEVVAVIGHELGHWKLSHNVINLVISELTSSEEVNMYMLQLIGYLGICWSRKMEFAADKFSASVGYAQLLQSALIKLSKDNLIFPVDDWLYSAWHYSHPPIIERIRALKKFE
ncbi:unnamed protein product [Soboliphyme baturini]|uniref:CAAX prenyl protease n=1 Tax=Soboliphyme baturini TaxID=241478 RepID=A0A183IZI8_9BILA|nr:unnamed protein product [Soboliphyme baturini]